MIYSSYPLTRAPGLAPAILTDLVAISYRIMCCSSARRQIKRLFAPNNQRLIFAASLRRITTIPDAVMP